MAYYHPIPMKKHLLIIGFLAAACAFAFAQAEPEEPPTAVEPSTGQVTAFFPAGGEIFLEGPPGQFRLESGRALQCPAGEYLLQFRHPDYADYMRKVVVRADERAMLLPELEYAGAYWAAQATALEAKRSTIAATKKKVNGAALAGGAMGVASALAVGAVELLLASKKSELDATYDEYRAASAADAPGIWTSIEDQKAGIDKLRLYEYLALGGAGLFAGASWAVASAAPTTANIDKLIEKLREEAEK